MKTIEFNPTLTVTYTVDKCQHEKLNGTHTEEFKLDNLSSEDIIQYLAQCLVIKRQSSLRSKTADKLVLGVWDVPAPGRRISVDPIAKATELLNKLTPEQKKAIAAAMGFSFTPEGLAEPDADLENGEKGDSEHSDSEHKEDNPNEEQE
jgi:hypothetical protein